MTWGKSIGQVCKTASEIGVTFSRNCLTYRMNIGGGGIGIDSFRKSETDAWHYSISNARCLLDKETKIQNLSNRRRAF